MTHRFFVAPPGSADVVNLPPSEAHHLVHVLRNKVGDEVVLFDGHGMEFRARVTTIRRGDVELQLIRAERVDRELATAIVLGVALPKGERQRWLVEKSVELGVQKLVPLETERGIAQPGAKAIERLTRFVIEASKQCGRNRLLNIAAPEQIGGYLEQAPATAVRWLAHPRSGGISADPSPDPAREIYLAIGPEGGFTEAEVTAARSCGWQVVDLGPRLLRVETAALYLTAIAAARAGGAAGRR